MGVLLAQCLKGVLPARLCLAHHLSMCLKGVLLARHLHTQFGTVIGNFLIP